MLRARPELANLQMSYGDEHRAIHFAVMERSPEMVRAVDAPWGRRPRGIHPHRDATTAWIIAKERGFDDIVAIIEEEEQKRRPTRSRRSLSSHRR